MSSSPERSLRPSPGHDLVLTVDAVVAGVHFFADDPADAVAHKALGVNVSDLAAKGAAPAGFLLTLALPDDWSEAWLAAFAKGLGEAARAFACPLLAQPHTAADLGRAVLSAGLDRSACFHVRDLEFSEEDAQFYLTDGYLIFGKPFFDIFDGSMGRHDWTWLLEMASLSIAALWYGSWRPSSSSVMSGCCCHSTW